MSVRLFSKPIEPQPAFTSTSGGGVDVTADLSALAREYMPTSNQPIVAAAGLTTACNSFQGVISASQAYSRLGKAVKGGDQTGQVEGVLDLGGALAQTAGGTAFAVNRITSIISFTFGIAGGVALVASAIGSLSFTVFYAALAVRFTSTVYHTHQVYKDLCGGSQKTAERIDTLSEKYFPKSGELPVALSKYIGAESCDRLSTLLKLYTGSAEDQKTEVAAEIEVLLSKIGSQILWDQSLSVGLVVACLAGIVAGTAGDILGGVAHILNVVCFGLMLITDFASWQAGVRSTGQIGVYDKERVLGHTFCVAVAVGIIITLLATSGVATFGIVPAVVTLAICTHWLVMDGVTFYKLTEREKGYNESHLTLDTLKDRITNAPEGTGIDEITKVALEHIHLEDLETFTTCLNEKQQGKPEEVQAGSGLKDKDVVVYSSVIKGLYNKAKAKEKNQMSLGLYKIYAAVSDKKDANAISKILEQNKEIGGSVQEEVDKIRSAIEKIARASKTTEGRNQLLNALSQEPSPLLEFESDDEGPDVNTNLAVGDFEPVWV